MKWIYVNMEMFWYYVKFRKQKIYVNKCSERGMEVKRPAILGNHDRYYDRQTNRQTDKPGDREV